MALNSPYKKTDKELIKENEYDAVGHALSAVKKIIKLAGPLIALVEFIKRHSHVNWALADQVIVSGVNFMTGLMVAKFLGIEEFGRFTLLWMAILFINSFQMAIISSPMMSIGPKQREKEVAGYYQAVMFQQLLFSLITLCLLYFGVKVSVAIFPSWDIEGYAIPLAVAGFFFQNQDFLRRYYFTQQRASSAFWNDALSYLSQIILLSVLFYFYELNARDVLWVIGMTSGIAVCVAMLGVEKKFSNINELKITAERHWDFSKWSALSALLQWISGNLVFVITGSVLGASSVGLMKVAQNIMAVSHILFQGMENFVPAKASLIFHNSGFNDLKVYKNKVTLIGGGVTLFFVALVFSFSSEIMAVVYDESFVKHAYVLQWFSIIYIFMFGAFPLRAALRAIEKTRSIFYSQIAASCFVAVFSFLLQKEFGIIGALISLLISYVVVLVALQIQFSRVGLNFSGNATLK